MQLIINNEKCTENSEVHNLKKLIGELWAQSLQNMEIAEFNMKRIKRLQEKIYSLS
jgi:hypothetical protein